MSEFCHDLGFKSSLFSQIDIKDAPLTRWEQNIHALLVLLATKSPPLMTTDELRQGVEALSDFNYNEYTYYERWAVSMMNLLIERGVISHEEVFSCLGINTHDDPDLIIPAKFEIGQTVQIKTENIVTRFPKPHLRVPGYVFGMNGTIRRHCGNFRDPSLLAFRIQSSKMPLYIVGIKLRDIKKSRYYPSENDEDEAVVEAEGGIHDEVEIEVYQTWLEEAVVEKDEGLTNASLCVDHNAYEHLDNDLPISHCQDHAKAMEKDSDENRSGTRLAMVLIDLLLQREIITSEQLARTIDKLESGRINLKGADLVVEAWTNPEFKQSLLQDAPLAALKIGIETSNPNAPTHLIVVENTATEHHVIVCTLCSCYPASLLGLSPSWYKSSSYRSQIVRDPRRVLKQSFGLALSADIKVIVHDSTADCRYMVLPMMPKDIEGYSKEDLRKLITRDSLIGVSRL